MMPPFHIICSRLPTVCLSQFLASVIAIERKGRPLTDRQAEVLANIVRRFHGTTLGFDVTP
jgi:hypothetical protein